MKTDTFSSLPLWKKLTAAIFLSPVLFFLIIFILTLWGFFGYVPGTKELSRINHNQPTVLISSDGKEIGSLQSQSLDYVALEEIDSTFLDALLAIEDVRFRSHNGIDYRALGRVIVKSILLGENAGGGSTLTQQLAKNLYPRVGSSNISLAANKLREMIIAKRLESVYTKDEILELYLNNVSFGEDTIGIQMAAYRYFSKPASDLSLSEAATLAGVLKATTYYNPHRNPDRSKARRNLVIKQMEKYGFIDRELAEETIQKEMGIRYDRSSGLQNLAPYFKVQLRKELTSILDTLKTDDDIDMESYQHGLVIHTTLNAEIQQAAEKAVFQQIKQLQTILDAEINNRPIFGDEDPDVLRIWQRSEQYKQLTLEGFSEQQIDSVLHQPEKKLLYTLEGYKEQVVSPYDEIRYYLSFLNAGFIALHPQTGNVLAWVGGVDYRHFPYDQILASRQPGSAFKPILYAAAIESGRTPCDYQRNVLTRYASYDDWTPQNNNKEYGGRYSLQGALAQSVNTVAVQLAAETGIDQISSTARKMGIHTPLPDGLSVALGTAQMSLLELTTAYSSFINEGKPVKPNFISKIYTDEGNLIYDAEEQQTAGNLNPQFTGVLEVDSPLFLNRSNGIDEGTAATLTLMLEKTVNEGTAAPLRNIYSIDHALAGKTGTTQNYTDGWFIGFTPEIVFGTRVGGANHRVRFREYPAYASQTALPIAGRFLQNIEQSGEVAAQPATFTPDQVNSPYSLQCSDTKNDRITDRIKDFFTGKSSDEPRVVGDEQDKKKRGNIFKRIGRGLGIVNDDDDNEDNE